jgi:hypothetical protein
MAGNSKSARTGTLQDCGLRPARTTENWPPTFWLAAIQPPGTVFEKSNTGSSNLAARRQEWQQGNAENFAPRVRWFTDLKTCHSDSKLRKSAIDGIIFSNELLDAFPVHRLGWDAKTKNGSSGASPLKAKNSSGRKFLKNPNPQLPSSIFHLEAFLAFCPTATPSKPRPAAENWWREAAGVLARGKLLAIDYGFHRRRTVFARAHGTARSAPISAITSATTCWPTPANRTSPRTSIFPPFKKPAKPPG